VNALIPDKDHALELLRDSQQRFCALLRAVEDPKRSAIGKWDIGTTATHVGHVFRILPSVAYGTPSPVPNHRALADEWDRMLAEDRERDPKRVADRIDGYTEEFFDAIGRAKWTEPVVWHGRVRIPAYCLPSLLLNETEIHGLDIARGEDRTWEIPKPQALNILIGLLPLLPHFVNHEQAAGVDTTWELKPRGGPNVYVTMREGKLSITEQPSGKADCKISVDPATYLLVGYGRVSQWGALAKGKIVAYGRKPWLGLKFAKLFAAP
jgi:Mycothiol maleylpyruvate isomerase N-terminal domain/SCP-2 sterol transfer family